jgi:molybdopterin-guanine dinucleotide biosynthesis protein A
MFQMFPTRPALLLACDLPRLEARLLERLMEELSCELETLDGLSQGIDAAAFATSAPPLGWEPCCAIYMPSSALSVSDRIERGEYSLQGLLKSIRTKTVLLTGGEAELLANMNRPEDITGLGG